MGVAPVGSTRSAVISSPSAAVSPVTDQRQPSAASTTSTRHVDGRQRPVDTSMQNIRDRLTPCHSGVSRAIRSPTGAEVADGEERTAEEEEREDPEPEQHAEAPASECSRAEKP